MPAWTEAEVSQLHSLRSSGKSYREISGTLGRSMKSIEKKCQSLAIVAPKEQPQEKFEITEHGDTRSIESVSTKIRTVEDALRHGEVDMDIFQVDRSCVNAWQVAMKVKDANGDEVPQVVDLWQVKVTLKRKVSRMIEDATSLLIDKMKKHAPRYHRIRRCKADKDNLLEISLCDVHFGKLSWCEETRENYDLKIAEKVWQNAVEDLVKLSSGFGLESIILPIGNDFFHIDGNSNMTTAGTPQDVDGRYAKMFVTGVTSCVKSIDYLREIAPVHVVHVKGNHDSHSGFHLVSELAAWYSRCPDVTFDKSPRQRKFYQFGTVMLCFTHGNEEKHADLPLICATEESVMFSQTKHHEIHLGHYHKAKETRFLSTDTFGAFRVRVLPSLSAADEFHYSKGYIGSLQAAEAYLWNKRLGYVGHFSAASRA